MDKRILELYKIAKDCADELKSVRHSCKHKDTHVQMHSIRIGCYTPKVLCKDCGEVVGEPSKEDSEKCWVERDDSFS